MTELTNKEILLLAPSFYGYENEIKDKLSLRESKVHYYNVNPPASVGTFIGVLRNFSLPTRWVVECFENRLYSKINSQKYDYVIVICGWAVTSRLTSQIRRKLLAEKGKMILYYWDSFERLKDDHKRWDDFDTIYTFDSHNYREYSDQINFLPLFYCDRYWNKNKDERVFDCMIIGSFRLDRLDYVKNIKLANPNLNIKSFLYSKKWVILFHKILRKKYWRLNLSELEFRKLSSDEVVELYEKCNAVIDIPANHQTGLTIRTFETLAMHKKLITSNENIANYNFYDPNSIYIISEDCKLPNRNWFESPFSISDVLIKKYSIDNWLNKLLS